MTFKKLCDEWLTNKRYSVKETTYAGYVSRLKRDFLPVFGRKKLSDVTDDMLNRHFKRLLTEGKRDGRGGLAPKTVTDLKSIISQILKYSRKKGYGGPDPSMLMTISKPKPENKVLTKEEQKALEQFCLSEGDPLCVGVILTLYSGLRIGELCALKWGDIDQKSGQIRVTKTMTRVQNFDKGARHKTKVIIGEPKTASSRRTIPLPTFLKAYVASNRRGDDCYITTGTPDYTEPRTCRELYKKILKAAGVQDCSFHALRHTFATRCVEINFDIKTLSEILGHSSVGVTMNRYVHPTIEMKQSGMDRLGSLTTVEFPKGPQIKKA